MGKAIDLPDPLDTDSPLNGMSPMSDGGGAAPAGNADDILSQLAGDEIDRLLAEADVEPEPAVGDPAPSSAHTVAADEVADPADVETIDSVFDASPDSAVTGKSPFAEAVAPIDSEALTPAALPALVKSEATANALTANGTFGAPVDDAVAGPEHPVSQPVDVDNAAPDGALDEYEPRVPLLLKPLAWINAPFDALPDGVRTMLGKVAILTLFNAVAILIYVLVFRH